jgi:hypothetical protein
MASDSPGSACWCYEATISDEVMERVPAPARGIVCICHRCATGEPDAATS